MKKCEVVVAVVFILVSCIVIGDTVRLGFGWGEYGPAAGFVPFWIAILMMVNAFVILVSGIRQKGGEGFFVSDQGKWEVGRIGLTSVLLTLGIVFLGVYFATILYSILFARWLGKHRWISVLVFAVLITIFIYFGMEKGLKITLPKSPLYTKGLFIF